MSKWKVNILFLLLIFVSGVIIWKLYYLQIKDGEYYEALALGQQVSFEEVKGKRGEIFFNKGELLLAQTKKKNIIYIFPKKIEDKEETSKILADILQEEKDDLLLAFNGEDILKREVSDEALEKIKKGNIKGVYPDEILGRFYPQKELASQVVGFLNEEGEGQYGVEGHYDEILRGEESLREKERSPLGYLTSFLDSKDDEFSGEGADIYLTLDYNIQYFTEKILKEAKEKWDIDSGQIIVQEPSTGKILALANFPNFDPNQYSIQEDFEIFLNSSVQKLHEPGSIFKPITMAGALEERLITPETEYEDKGSVDVGGPPIYNFQKRIWGIQTMTDVLEESINTGAIFVQRELGNERFLSYIEKFGFFEKTNIDLQTETFSLNETLKHGYPRDFATAAFGQGIQVTLIQIVRAFGAIANGGKLMKPYIVEKIVKANGEETIIEPHVQGTAISERTAAKLTSMLVSVVEQGSGRGAKIDGYFITGKTGTAQVPLSSGGYSEHETIHSFIGYFPALAPKILISIKLDNPKGVGTAGYSTVPFFKKLAKYIIDLWQIPPSYPQ